MTPLQALNDMTHELIQRHIDMIDESNKKTIGMLMDAMGERALIIRKALNEFEALKKENKDLTNKM